MAWHRRHRTDDDDHSPWATVVAIDPGGTTGWSVIMVHPDSLIEEDTSILGNMEHFVQGQATGHEHAQEKELLELLEAWPDAAVVIEDFILRKQLRDRALLSPVRITEVLDFWCWMEQRRTFKQQPSAAKGAVTDERLKAWGLYIREGGEEHARDATRHGIHFLRRAKESPKLRKMAWPYLFDNPEEKS